ncbi:MAG: primosomal protein N' [Eubacteriales bacterium]|nr:primosomal protein N' [Eubacteriales bacterium]
MAEFSTGITAQIVIANAARSFDREYTYLVPQSLEGVIQTGSRAVVPFGISDRATEGYVFGINKTVSGAVGDIQDGTGNRVSLKMIKEILGTQPVLNNEIISLCRWMKKRYICTYGDAVKTVLPPGTGMKTVRKALLTEGWQTLFKSLRKDDAAHAIIDYMLNAEGACEEKLLKAELSVKIKKGIARAFSYLVKNDVIEIRESYSAGIREKTLKVVCSALPPDEIASLIEQGSLKSIKQVRVLELLLDNDYIPVRDILRITGLSSGVLETLKKNGLIFFRDIEMIRDPFQETGISPEKQESHTLTGQQKQITDSLKKDVDRGGFAEALIHGVTGSGKTEIYLQLIKHLSEKGRQAIVLVPEISLTPQMIRRFRSRFGDRVALIHSRMSLGERHDQWKQIKEGNVIAAVGARSAVFAPFERLGMVIIDEEHETSYKSEITPRYHAAEVARQRCMECGGMVIYGSATPSVETYHRALTGEIKLHSMDKRPGNISMPAIKMVDMRSELDSGNRSMFSRELAASLRETTENRLQSMLFINRRGHSSFVLCRGCGFVLKCPDCNISLTYHSEGDRLICHYCGYTARNPAVCPSCGSRKIRHFGTGTQKVEKEIISEFPECRVLRMDMDTTAGRHSHRELLDAFAGHKADILLGTQMIAKGHDFPDVAFVGVLAADSMLNIGDYRASERTFQLLSQVSGRAGRGDHPGKVIIQTYNTEAYSITAAVNGDYEGFYLKETSIRKQLGYPPYKVISAVTYSGANDRTALKFASDGRKILEETAHSLSDVEIIGPVRTPVTRIKGNFRWRIVLKTDTEADAIEILTALTDKQRISSTGNASGKVGASVDINPAGLI